MPDELQSQIRDVFVNVQFNKTSHQNFRKKLKKLYMKSDFDTFTDYFITCLKAPLVISDNHPHVECVLQFAAIFACSIYTLETNQDTDQMCPFLTRIFEFIFAHHNAKDQTVRFRLCYFLNMLLNTMGEDAFLEDYICDKITSCMMDRLLDRAPKVRAQAVLALHRLQDPTDDNCPVIKTYIFHLSKDPNVEVRKAVLNCMAKCQKALQAVLKRTRDVNENVRKLSYDFISKITVKSLTIKQRETLVNEGLKDRSELVSKVVRSVLLPSWLLHFSGDYMKLLRALDVESATETAILALNVLFKRDSLVKLLAQLPVDSETKLIPMEKLTSETVLYWRCFVEYLYKESCADEVDQCLPELSKFCEYIRQFIEMMGAQQCELVDMLTRKFILHQLFKIAQTFDLGDEIGRSNLMQLIIDTLQNEHCTDKITECIVEYFELVVPDVDSRITSLVHVISEIRLSTPQFVPTQVCQTEEQRIAQKLQKAKLRVKLNEIQEEEYEAIRNRNFIKAQALKEQLELMEKELNELTTPNTTEIIENDGVEKSDPETLTKCLSIMCCMTSASSVTTVTSALRSLLEILALPNIDHEDNTVHVLALKAVATCCLLDADLARKHIIMFIMQFSVDLDDRDTWVISLQAIFDLLLCYGLEFFGISQVDNEASETLNKSKRIGTVKLYNHTEEDMTCTSVESNDNHDGANKFVKILISLIDNGDQEIRTIAAEGLCKLLLHGKVSGAHLVSRLLILLYNPVSEDDVYLRQCLCSFFKTFSVRGQDSQEMLEQAFMPTLRTLANAPDASPLQAIEPCYVTSFILGLTSSRNHKPGSECYTVHNNLAVAILAEALDITSNIDEETLLKSLKYLDVQFEDDLEKKNVYEAADKIEKSLPSSDKRLVKYIQQFKSKIADIDEPTEKEKDKENVETMMDDSDSP